MKERLLFRMKIKMQFMMVFALFFSSTCCNAELLGFSCDQYVSKKFSWHWDLLIDKDSGKGTMNGISYSGINDEIHTPYSWPLQLTFTPDHLFFQKIGNKRYQGTINRRTLVMSYGGGTGKCTLVPVKNHSNLF
jgi:hypothetical protein